MVSTDWLYENAFVPRAQSNIRVLDATWAVVKRDFEKEYIEVCACSLCAGCGYVRAHVCMQVSVRSKRATFSDTTHARSELLLTLWVCACLCAVVCVRVCMRVCMQCRLPGAMYFDIDRVADLKTTLPHMLPTPQEFAEAVQKMGAS